MADSAQKRTVWNGAVIIVVLFELEVLKLT